MVVSVHSVTHLEMCDFLGNRVRLPGIGWMRFFQSRPFPDGFAVRSVTVRRKVDGWHVSVRLQDDTVPAPLAQNEIRTAIGVDLGITKLASLSTGETIANPHFAQKAERKRKILHRRVSRKKKGSRSAPQSIPAPSTVRKQGCKQTFRSLVENSE